MEADRVGGDSSCQYHAVIERYTLPEMGRIWSEQRRLELWKEVERLALEAWEELGKVPPIGCGGGGQSQVPHSRGCCPS